ncbi:MAG: arabinofuranosyltransferase [Promethearchaeota archaeon]
MSYDKSFKKELKENKLKDQIKNLFKIEIVQEIIFSALGILIFNIVYLFLPSTLWSMPYRMIFCALLTLTFFMIFIFLNQPNSKNKILNVNYKRNIIIFTLFNVSILSFLFFRTELGYNGLQQDNFYRTIFITQMAHSGYPRDLAFKGLPAFMAPLYWYILALISIIFHIKPYKMIKIGFLISYTILPPILYETWKKIFDEKTSFFITIIFFSFIANYYEIIWIDHLIGYAFFIPYFIYYFENYKNKEFSNKDYIIGGFLGSLLLCTFYLYFLIVPIYLFLIFIQNAFKNDFLIFKEKFIRITKISIIILIFSSWFWLPLIISIILIGIESHQNLFFPKYTLDMPFQEYLNFNLFSIVLILGIVFILMKYHKSSFLKILGNIIISVYILYTLGFICLLIGFPIVHYRILIVSYYAIIISFSIFYIQFFYILKNSDIYNQLKNKIDIQTLEIFILIVIIFYQNYNNIVELNKSESYKKSFNQKIPDEVEIFSKLDYEDKVFLTQYDEVAAYLPIYLFIVANPHFSHPSALNNERIKFLEELSECKSSKEFYKKLMNNKFGPIDYFILEPTNENATEFLFDSAELEYYPRSYSVKIYYSAKLFEDRAYFERYKIQGVIIYKTIY